MAIEPRDDILLSSASRTTTQTVTKQINARSISVVVDITDVSAGPSITVAIKAWDNAKGAAYKTLLTSAALVAAATTVLQVTPDLTASANAIAQDLVPATIQVVVTANNANACVYSVGLQQHA